MASVHSLKTRASTPVPRGAARLVGNRNCVQWLARQIRECDKPVLQLEDETGVHHSTIYRILEGKASWVQPGTISALAAMIGVRVPWDEE